MTDLPILISPGFSCVVKQGDEVTIGQVLAKKDNTPDEAINLAEKLKVPAHTLPKMLTKKPGDEVKKGDALAVKRGFLGLSNMQILSKIDGTVVRFEREEGILVIRLKNPKDYDVKRPQSETGTEILSPIEGKVSLCNNEKIVIKTEKNIIPAKNGTGETATGELYELHNSNEDQKSQYQLNSKAIGKIIACVTLTREQLMKALGIGVMGIILQEIAKDDLDLFSSRDKKTPLLVLGKEEFGTLLKKSKKQIFVNGREKVVLLLE